MLGCSNWGRYWSDCGIWVRRWKAGGFLFSKQIPAFLLPNKTQEHCRYAFRWTCCRREFDGKWQEILLPKDMGNTSPSMEILHVFVRCQLLPSWKLKYVFWQLWVIGIDPSQASSASFLYCLCIEQSTGILASISAAHKHCGFLATPAVCFSLGLSKMRV